MKSKQRCSSNSTDNPFDEYLNHDLRALLNIHLESHGCSDLARDARNALQVDSGLAKLNTIINAYTFSRASCSGSNSSSSSSRKAVKTLMTCCARDHVRYTHIRVHYSTTPSAAVAAAQSHISPFSAAHVLYARNKHISDERLRK
uniref:Uncharacterized protein n=1 Tax=Trichogramma kaykai TaxID=54128 RepID=A0ABD2VWZ3_9HYME